MTSQSFEQFLTGKQNRRPSEPKMLFRGKVLRVVGARAFVELPGFSEGKEFGPMQFGRTSTPPVAGDDAVITFLGQGTVDPWLIAWSSP